MIPREGQRESITVVHAHPQLSQQQVFASLKWGQEGRHRFRANGLRSKRVLVDFYELVLLFWIAFPQMVFFYVSLIAGSVEFLLGFCVLESLVVWVGLGLTV